MHYERIVQACIDFMNINIMQFRQHCARADKQNANFDHYFGINLRFLWMYVNGPLSSVKLYNKFY